MESKSDMAAGLPKIKFLGVGGAGANIADALAALALPNIEIAAADTDAERLKNSSAAVKIRLGDSEQTKFGTGGDTVLGKEAALAAAAKLENFAAGSDVFITAGAVGGGTASMALSLLAKISSSLEIPLTICFCVQPLSIEGEERRTLAATASRYIGRRVHAMVELPNDAILARSELSVEEAFERANGYAVNAAASVARMLSKSGIVNIDFPSLSRAFSERGRETLFASAVGRGEDCAGAALEALRASPFLKRQEMKADSLFISVRCPRGFEMNKMQRILEGAAGEFSSGKRAVFGAIVEPEFSDEVEITLMGQMPPKTRERAAEEPFAEESQARGEQSGQEGKKSAVAFSNSAEERPVRARVACESNRENSSVRQRASGNQYIFPQASSPQVSPAQHSAPGDDAKQREFKFVEKSQQRGFFEDTPPNMRNGEDLDVPTFMRRCMKINL